MKLRFKVNQAECFRHGINCPKSIVVIEVDPSTLDIPTRCVIADHLVGIDVVKSKEPKELVEALTPDFEGLFEAIMKARKPAVSKPVKM